MKQNIDTNPPTITLTAEGGDSRSTTTKASLHMKASSSSSTIRFLGLLKQPDYDPNLFELDENDVVWSSDFSNSSDTLSYSPPTLSNSPTNLRPHLHHNSGLSAALDDDKHPLVRRKPALNSSLSAASAARTIPPVAKLKSDGKFHQSAPVNVPIWPKKIGEFRVGNLGSFDEVDEEWEEQMVPPHEIVARSHVTFSVFEGVGRTLKGRDLRRVRNAVFQKTGFID